MDCNSKRLGDRAPPFTQLAEAAAAGINRSTSVSGTKNLSKPYRYDAIRRDTTRYDAILPRSLPHLIEPRLKATVASGVCGDGGCRGECVRAQHYMR